MRIHPIDSWRGGAYVGEPCDQCANMADVVIAETAEEFESAYLRWFGFAPGPDYFEAEGARMALCLDCSPTENS